MKTKKVTVLIKEPNGKPILKDIEDDYKVFQGLVGGDFEITTLPNIKNVICYMNETGKLEALEPNLLLPHLSDVLLGTCVMVGVTNDGESKSLTNSQIRQCKKYIEYFDYPNAYDFYNEKDRRLLKSGMAEIYDDYLRDEAEM